MLRTQKLSMAIFTPRTWELIKSVCRKPMEIGETSVEITEHSNIKTNLQVLIIMSQ